MGNAAPPSWLHFGRQSLLLNHQLAGLFLRYPSIGPGKTLWCPATTMASGIGDFPATFGGSTHMAFSYWISYELASSSYYILMFAGIQGIIANVRHTFTGNLHMMADSCLVPRLPLRVNHPLPLCISWFPIPRFLSRVFPPSGHGLPACGEV
jgi:hypothetical protein